MKYWLNTFSGLGLVMMALVMIPLEPAKADLTWESTTTTVLKVGATVEKMGEIGQSYSLKYNVLRVDDLEQTGARLLNFQNQMAVIFEFTSKTFILVTIPELIAAAEDERAEVMKDLPNREAQLKDLPAKERAVLAGQLEAQKKKYELFNKPYTVSPTQEESVIAGHPCLKYVGLAGGEAFQEIWVAKDLQVDPAYKNYYAPGMAGQDRQEFCYLPLVPGFVMKVVSRFAGVTVTTEVTHLSNAVIPLDAFLIPPEFKPNPEVPWPGE